MGLLRLCFALIVVLGHSDPGHARFPIIDSDGAVLGFFVLSGFYMAMVLETRYRDDLKTFYCNRFVRLYPTYLLCLLATAGTLAYLSVVEGRFYGPLRALAEAPLSPVAELWSALSQLSMWGQDFGTYIFVGKEGGLHFAPNPAIHGESFFNYNFIPQAWTLSTELTFYALVPFMNRWRTWVLAALFLGGLLVRVAGIAGLPPGDLLWFNRLLPLELSVFCGGMLAWRRVRPANGNSPRDVGRMTLVGAGGLLVGGWFWDKTPAHCATVPLLVALTLPWLWSNLRKDALDRFLGDLSYPVYVCHILICYALLAWLPQDRLKDLPLVAMLGSLVAAAILRFGLEKPLAGLKRAPQPRRA